MHSLKLAIGCAWLVFWIYWLASAASSKESVPGGWRTRLTGVSAVGVFVIAGVLRDGGLAVHSVILAAVGAALFACGIALAVWARLYLGRNWGMPMTQRAEPELVTSGPYRFVRHPIYTGLLTALLGTALVNNLLGLIVVAVAGRVLLLLRDRRGAEPRGHLPQGVPGVRKQDQDAHPVPAVGQRGFTAVGVRGTIRRCCGLHGPGRPASAGRRRSRRGTTGAARRRGRAR